MNANKLRIALLTVGSIGDLLPFAGLALALRSRGHEVSLLFPAPHGAQLAGQDLALFPYGDRERYEAMLRDPGLWNPRRGFGTVWQGIMGVWPEVSAALDKACADGVDLVLGHPLAMPLLDLARARFGRARVVAVQLAPSNLRTVHDPLTMGPLVVPRWVPQAWRAALWRYLDRRYIDPFALPSLNTERQRLGLAPVAHFLAHIQAAADAHLALFPSRFATVAPDWPQPLRMAGFVRWDPQAQAPLAAALESFLQAGPPPVVVTLGTSQRQAMALYGRVARAVLAAGQRPLVLCGVRPALPEGAHWQPYAPLARVLPRAGAVVHHGGIGTTAEALAAGLPQLVLPFAYDQFDNAARLATLGVARVVPAAYARESRVRRTVRAWLQDNGHRVRAQALAAMPSPDLDETCEWLEARARTT